MKLANKNYKSLILPMNRGLKQSILSVFFLFSIMLNAHATMDSTDTPADSVLQHWDRMVEENFGHKYEVDVDSFFDYRSPVVDSLVRNSLDDSLLALKFDTLNAMSPIDLTYNDVVGNFVHLYLVRRKNLTSGVLSRMGFYFNVYEQMLDKYNLPLELKYLSIIESALKQEARSWAGASGLWQFMSGTARMYDLDVGAYVDERYDMYRATEAAAQHLRDLYKYYNDWLLALAAYNCGSGNVNRAIRRAGGEKDFWKIKRFLPRETQGYVPSFIAVNYVFNYADDHFIKPGLSEIPLLLSDTVVVKDKLRFEQIAEVIDVDEEELEIMNPTFRRGIIPASEHRSYTIYLPRDKVDDFLASEDTIYTYKTKAQREMERRLAEKYGPVTQGVHIVKSGQSLGYIASKYGCDILDLKDWNNLNSNMIHPGDKLIVFAPENVLNGEIAPQAASPTYSSSNGDDYIYHTVRRGDTLSEIAEMYPRTSVREIKRLNNISNERRLRLGQKLKIAPSNG